MNELDEYKIDWNKCKSAECKIFMPMGNENFIFPLNLLCLENGLRNPLFLSFIPAANWAKKYTYIRC